MQSKNLGIVYKVTLECYQRERNLRNLGLSSSGDGCAALYHTVGTSNKGTPNKATFALFALKSENVQIRQCLI